MKSLIVQAETHFHTVQLIEYLYIIICIYGRYY